MCGSFRRSNRTASPVESKVIAINGLPILFDLARALKENDILDPRHRDSDLDAAEEKWNRCVDDLFADLPNFKIDDQKTLPDPIEEQIVNLDHAIIGWDYDEYEVYKAHLCLDIELTIAVLSRTVGGIFFKGRVPDHSWSALFGQRLAVDIACPYSDMPVVEIVQEYGKRV